MKPRRSSAFLLISVVALGAGVTVAWQQSDFGKAAGDLENQRAAARREGLPLDWADLRKLNPPLTPSQNGAELYRLGFAELHHAGNFQGVPVDKLIKALADGKADAKDVVKAETALKAAGPALTYIQQASERQGFWIDRKWEMGPALTFPEPSDARSAGRALVLRAMLSKDPQSAAKDLRAAARISTHFGSEPILISALVGSAIENSVHQGIRALGRRGGAWTAAMLPVADAFGPLPDLHHSLAGEIAMGNHLTDELARHGSNAFTAMGGEGTPAALRLSGFGPIRNAFQSRVVEYWRKVYAALPADPLDVAASRTATTIPIPTGPSQALLDMATPILSGVGDLAPRMEAERRLTRTALQLWAGQSPSIPKDPFTASSLHLRRTGSDWTIWSVGPDGLDDGGKPRVKEMDPRFDMVVQSTPKP